MQFNNSSSKEVSLYHDCLGTLGISESDTTTYPIATFTRNANKWLATANQWIWDASGEWEYDDSNLTTLPVSTTNLVDAQQDYQIPSTCQKIDRVEVMDDSGDWHKLTPINKEAVEDALAEYESTDGLPAEYDIVGNSLILYPIPDTDSCTLTAGLKLYYSRDLDNFTITDTTQAPGFVQDFHEIISKGAAIEWATAYMPERVAGLYQVISRIKSDMQKFYGSRSRDLKVKINTNYKFVK